MLLREVRARFHTEVLSVDLGTRYHINCILNWTNCMTNSATSTILLNDLGECIVTVKLNSLVSRVGACQEASSALQAVIFIDNGSQELLLCHLINW